MTERRTGFNPAEHSFRFSNTFQNDFIREFDVRTGGLCGGMAYAALDYFLHRRPIPTQDHRPAVHTPLHDYIYDRQVRSLALNADKWTELNFNPFGWRNREFFNWGIQGTGGGRLQELRREIDAGRPVPLGLQVYGHADTDPKHHQVLAIGYDLGRYRGDLGSNAGDLRILVYDPNRPRAETVLRPNLRDLSYFDEADPERRWRTYFVDMRYRAQVPPTIASPRTDGPAGRITHLLLEIGTGADDLRGGKDNVDVVVNLRGSRQEQLRNANGGRRWIGNHTQTVRLDLDPPANPEDLVRIGLRTSFGGGIGGDNWNVDHLLVRARGNGVDQRVYDRAGSPLVRLTGERRTFLANVQPPRWRQVAGAARDIALGADGSVYVIGTDRNVPAGNGGIHRWRGRGWERIPGYGTRIAVDPSGKPWIVNTLGEIWGPRGRMPGSARDIGVGADGSVYVIGTDRDLPAGNGRVYRLRGDRWESAGGEGVRISVDPRGRPWVVNAAGEIWGPDGRVNGAARDIAVAANGAIYVIGTDNPAPGNGSVFHLGRAGWVRLETHGTAVSADTDGRGWVVRSDAQIWSGGVY